MSFDANNLKPADPAEVTRALNYLLHGGFSRKEVTVKVRCKVLQATYISALESVAVKQDVMQYQFGVPMPTIMRRVHHAEFEVSGHPDLKKLIFNGTCHIKTGDTIDAYVVCGDKKSFYAKPPETRQAYEKREIRQIEVADKIEKIIGKTISATYRAE